MFGLNWLKNKKYPVVYYWDYRTLLRLPVIVFTTKSLLWLMVFNTLIVD